MKNNSCPVYCPFTHCLCHGPGLQTPYGYHPQGLAYRRSDAKAVANTMWWEQFNDPVLTELIQIALKENYDLKIATARVEEYVGRYWVGRSGSFPADLCRRQGEGSSVHPNGSQHRFLPQSTTRQPSTRVLSAVPGRSTSGDGCAGSPRQPGPTS